MSSARVTSQADVSQIRLCALQRYIKTGPYTPGEASSAAAANLPTTAPSSSETAVMPPVPPTFDGSTPSASSKHNTSSANSSENHPLVEEAWKELTGINNVFDAKKEFLLQVVSFAPYWKYEQFLS
jgi:hypothetical protein